jgi:hypothetical protein
MSTGKAPSSPAVPPPRQRAAWVSLLIYLVVFVSGSVCGAGLTLVVARHRIQRLIHHPEAGMRQLDRALEDRLRLTPDQRTKVRAILEKRQAALQRARRIVQPQIEREFGELVKEINDVLTPRQQRAWHRMVSRMRRWFPPPAAAAASQDDAASGP